MWYLTSPVAASNLQHRDSSCMFVILQEAASEHIFCAVLSTTSWPSCACCCRQARWPAHVHRVCSWQQPDALLSTPVSVWLLSVPSSSHMPTSEKCLILLLLVSALSAGLGNPAGPKKAGRWGHEGPVTCWCVRQATKRLSSRTLRASCTTHP